jgi:hypothetical protein
MTAAVIGLIGVFLGALMAQAGSILTDRGQSQTRATRWRRDRKAEAYDGALPCLLRAADFRHGGPELGAVPPHLIAIVTECVREDGGTAAEVVRRTA